MNHHTHDDESAAALGREAHGRGAVAGAATPGRRQLEVQGGPGRRTAAGRAADSPGHASAVPRGRLTSMDSEAAAAAVTGGRLDDSRPGGRRGPPAAAAARPGQH